MPEYAKRHLAANGVPALPQVKNIIAVASGKGGVGKSTVALNLALAMQKIGAKVGLLDADIYGPSQPHMLGISDKPIIRDDKSIEPIYAHGMQTMSIGYLIDANTPAVWRGPMVSGALQQMLNSTNWFELDVLIIDLPPGTGDIQLTLAQKVPVVGAVVVTTPQDVALIDVTKAINMFTRVKVPVLGVVENMSVHVCTNCGHEDHIFGRDGGNKLSNEHGVELLGSIPLQRNICVQSDLGRPVLIDGFVEIANKIERALTKVKRDFGIPQTKIVVENV